MQVLKKNSYKLTVYILCRDRPQYAIQAIKSVLKSANEQTEVVISDNSETDSLEKICSTEFPSIQYIRRQPPRTWASHVKQILDEVRSEYFVLFHDDDIMLEAYIPTLINFMDLNTKISAVGCNAEVIDGAGKKVGIKFLSNLKSVLIITNTHQFISPYLMGSFCSNGIAPFPSYMYRQKYISSSFINYKEGGKFSDVTFLLKVLQEAPMAWYPDSLILYRNHGANDSATESIPDRLSLIRFLIKCGLDRRSLDFQYFRFNFWINWWVNCHMGVNLLKSNGWRQKIVLYFLIKTCIKLGLRDRNFNKLILRKFFKLLTYKKIKC